jgi:lysophospholipase L1-like esterase
VTGPIALLILVLLVRSAFVDRESRPTFDPSKVVVGFGDSVAAGYGLGAASGYPNNPNSYPLLLAQKLGWSGHNFAVTYACAATVGQTGSAPGTPSKCQSSVAHDQLPAAEARLTRPPTLVTLTIGANDIEWGLCSIFQLSPVSLPFLDPCAEPALTRNLEALEENLTGVVNAIATRFPGTAIALTTYYNPFPPAPADPGSAEVCPIFRPIAAIKRSSSLTDLLTFSEAAAGVQAETHAVAESVLGRLNEVIERVGDRANATVVPLDFRGHDFCQVQTGGSVEATWAYGPEVHASLSVTGTVPLPAELSWDLLFPEACVDRSLDPGPFGQDEPVRVQTQSGALYEFTGSFAVNCLPHPTDAGQQRIAEDIRARITP